MPIKDLIPWGRKRSKAKVPVKVTEQALATQPVDFDRARESCSPWRGLAPLGALSDRWDLFGPRMDMVETRGALRLSVEGPGMGADDIDVHLLGNRLVITEEKRREEEGGGHQTYYLRRSQESFRRSVNLPCPVNADNAEARLSRGLLTISLPKEGTSGRKRIAVGRP